MTALILCWHCIYLAVINFQLLNLTIWFDIRKGLSVVLAVLGRFVNHISDEPDFVENKRVLQNNLGKPKIPIQIIKNAKRNRYKRTNEQWYSRSLWPFQGDRDEVLNGNQTRIN